MTTTKFIEVSESESDTSDMHTQVERLPAVGKQWSSQETAQLLETSLGPDSKHREFNENPMRIFTKARDHITSYHDWVFRAFLDKLWNTHAGNAIVHLENWTSNGSQDFDVDKGIECARKVARHLITSKPETATSVGTATTGGTAPRRKSITSKVIKSVPPSTSMNAKGDAAAAVRTTATKNALTGPAKPTYHKSAVSLSSRPADVVARATTSMVCRPHRTLDLNKKRDKPAGAHGALMLVKDPHVIGDVQGEDFLFDV